MTHAVHPKSAEILSVYPVYNLLSPNDEWEWSDVTEMCWSRYNDDMADVVPSNFINANHMHTILHVLF